MTLIVEKVNDFVVNGQGDNPCWENIEWHPLSIVGEEVSLYRTKAKVGYSDKGIYFLFDCEDKKITCTKTKDFDDIYMEDVVEVFLWPNEGQNLYFEYELSPLNVELPILVPNYNGNYHGWLPWHYESERRCIHKTTVQYEEKNSMKQVKAWRVEFFIPFSLFDGLGNNMPKPGTVWRANMYRIDYDEKFPARWAWCDKTDSNFHDIYNFGKFLFE